MTQTLTLILLISSFNIYSKEGDNPVFIDDGFKKIIKKRETSKKKEEKAYYQNKYKIFINSLIRKIRQELKDEIKKADPIKWNKENQYISFSAGEYYLKNSISLSKALLNQEYTADSLNNLINFWSTKSKYNSDYWIKICKKIHEKEEKEDKVKKRFRLTACNFYNDKTEVIYDF